jgi:hypothetical protein
VSDIPQCKLIAESAELNQRKIESLFVVSLNLSFARAGVDRSDLRREELLFNRDLEGAGPKLRLQPRAQYLKTKIVEIFSVMKIFCENI